MIPPPRKLEDTELFLAQTAKAIHVPKAWSHALSIKSLPEGPYEDGDIEFEGDGQWSFKYYQEEQDGVDPENLHTHKALMQCMKDGIPVAVLIRRQRKPQKILYDVVGLARVTGYKSPYFALEGPVEAFEGKLDESRSSFPEVSPRYAHVKVRHGQPAFRSELLRVFDGRCVISGCDVSQVLEAAHIVPYSQTLSNDPANGLLLRADLHTLYDLNLIRICPLTMKVLVDVSLMDTEYWNYNDRVLSLPEQNLSFLEKTLLE